MNNMLATSESSLNGILESTKNHVRLSNTATSNGFSAFESVMNSFDEAAKAAYNDIAHTAKTDLARNQEALADARLLARNVADTLAAARAQLPAHQAALAARVTAMRVTHARAAAHTQSMAAQTRAAAHEALQDVGEASQGTVAAAGAALSSLTASMDAEGESIQAGLHAHLAAMGAHFERQEAGLAGVGEASTAYGSEVSASVYANTGKTPRRGSFAPLEALNESLQDAELLKSGGCLFAIDMSTTAPVGATGPPARRRGSFAAVTSAPSRRRTIACMEYTPVR